MVTFYRAYLQESRRRWRRSSDARRERRRDDTSDRRARADELRPREVRVRSKCAMATATSSPRRAAECIAARARSPDGYSFKAWATPRAWRSELPLPQPFTHGRRRLPGLRLYQAPGAWATYRRRDRLLHPEAAIAAKCPAGSCR
jgi:hypothetical protein